MHCVVNEGRWQAQPLEVVLASSSLVEFDLSSPRGPALNSGTVFIAVCLLVWYSTTAEIRKTCAEGSDESCSKATRSFKDVRQAKMGLALWNCLIPKSRAVSSFLQIHSRSIHDFVHFQICGYLPDLSQLTLPARFLLDT